LKRKKGGTEGPLGEKAEGGTRTWGQTTEKSELSGCWGKAVASRSASRDWGEGFIFHSGRAQRNEKKRRTSAVRIVGPCEVINQTQEARRGRRNDL